MRRSSFATIVTISVTFFAIVLMVLSIFILFEAGQLSDRIKKSIEVNIYLDNDLNQGDIQSLYDLLLHRPEILSVKLITKEMAVNEFVKDTGEDFRRVLDQNPLPNSFVIKFKPDPLDEINIEKFTGTYRKMPGVTDVVYDYNTVLRLLTLLKSSEKVIYPVALLLVVLSLYMVYSNNKAQIHNNKNLYLTMKLVGARFSSMKIPLIINGIIVGIVASILCILLFDFGIVVLMKLHSGMRLDDKLLPINIQILTIGILLGFIGSFISSLKIRKLLEEK